MKLFIPAIGTKLKLLAPWNFNLYNEYRNATLMELIGDTRTTTYYNGLTAIPCDIQPGEVLCVDRIYLRKGNEDFDSITFRWIGAATQPRIEQKQVTRWNGNGLPHTTITVDKKVPRKPVRFWAKLEDVNNIECEVVV